VDQSECTWRTITRAVVVVGTIVTMVAESRPEQAVVARFYNFRVVTTGQRFLSVSEHPACMVRAPREASTLYIGRETLHDCPSTLLQHRQGLLRKSWLVTTQRVALRAGTRCWPLHEGRTHVRNATVESCKVWAQHTMRGLLMIGLVVTYVRKPTNETPLN